MASTITPTENLLNPQQFFTNNPPANLNRLLSIFELGTCGSLILTNYSQDHQRGYDGVEQAIVYFNAVNKAEKLRKAVFGQGGGIYPISTEYANDKELIKKLSNKEKIDEIFSKYVGYIEKTLPQLQETYGERLKIISFNESLKENSDFLNLLSERSHKIAVLIIDNVDLSPYEAMALDTAGGSYFFKRKTIEPKKIKYILMSEKLKNAQELKQIKDSNPDIELEFVLSSTQSAVPFSYKMKVRNIREIQKINVDFYAPDFLPKLTEIYNHHFVKHDKPMFIHTVRL